MKKKQFLVTKVNTDPDMTGVKVGNQEMNFSQSGYSFYMSDPGQAKELDATLGRKGTGDVVISEVPMANKEGIHNYTFTVKKPYEIVDDMESKYVWIEVKPGKWKSVKREEVEEEK